MQTNIFAIAMLLGLVGCASPPASENASSIEHVAAHLSGRELRLSLPDSGGDALDALSAARDPLYGYAGVEQAFAPARRQCEALGGTLQAMEQRAFSKATAALPTRLQCRTVDTLLWTLGLHYVVRTGADDKQRQTVFVTPQASLANEAEEERRTTQRSAAAKTEVLPRKKVKPAQKPESADRRILAPAPKIAGSVALKTFRQNLKAGDRVQWQSGGKPAKNVGTIVRLDGDLALIQFDNSASAGQSVRYVNRVQLEPFEGIASAHLAR